MKFSQSIVTRIVLLFTALLLFSILLTGYLVFKKSSVVIADHSKERILHNAELAQQSFYTLLQEVSNDAAIIANSPSLKAYIQQPDAAHVKEVEALFFTFLQHKDAYFQLRFIGIEDQGREIIRIDQKGNSVFRSDALQRKGDRAYFKEAIELKQGEIYYSRINLNEEFGKVSEPKTPTLRVAVPIFDLEHVILGLIVINVDLDGFYDDLRRIPGAASRLLIIDQSGQYLFAPDASTQFDKQLGHGHNFYTELLKDSGHESLEGEFLELTDAVTGNLFLSNTRELPYFNGKRKIFLISMMEYSSILKSAENVRAYSLTTILVVGLIAILITLMFARYFAKYLQQITDAIGNYEHMNDAVLDLPVHRKDEIGILARTFVAMKQRIDQHMQQLNSALQKEQHAKNQRDEFLQNMSHEMRTPLNAILGLTTLLHQDKKNPEQRSLINAIERSAHSLSGLVYDVLDHQNLVEGKLKIDLKPVNIGQILRDIHSTYQYESLQKGLDFELLIDKALEDHQFLTDDLRLSQIIVNLVVNATKYTESGKIVLQAGIKGVSGDQLDITVSDTGIGIHPDNIAKINDRFFRVDEGLSGRNYGYGLGLSIVKQLTALFGGTLQAKSTLGKGSSFHILLPVTPVAGHKTTITTHLVDRIQPMLEGEKLILHIEDDASTLDLVQHLIQDSQIELIQVSQLKAAKSFLSERSPDLVITDLMLHSDNIEAQIDTWVSEAIIPCPVLLISGFESNNINLANTFYLQKPFDISCFKDMIYRMLGDKDFYCPAFDNLYRNYDHHLEKVSHVLNLLEDEFNIYLERIKKVSVSKDQNEWEGIYHKIINHINNLDLIVLKKLLPKNVVDLDAKTTDQIENIFVYYGSCIRSEQCMVHQHIIKQH